MSTATEEINRYRDERDLDIFGQRYVDFRKRYTPKEDDGAYDFERDLFCLVQSLYVQAQKPFARELTIYRDAYLKTSMLRPLAKGDAS